MPIQHYQYTPHKPIIEAVLFDGTNPEEIGALTGADQWTIVENWDGQGHKQLNIVSSTVPYQAQVVYENNYLAKLTHPTWVDYMQMDKFTFEMDYSVIE